MRRDFDRMLKMLQHNPALSLHIDTDSNQFVLRHINGTAIATGCSCKDKAILPEGTFHLSDYLLKMMLQTPTLSLHYEDGILSSFVFNRHKGVRPPVDALFKGKKVQISKNDTLTRLYYYNDYNNSQTICYVETC